MNPYEVLGIEANASPDDIDKAFRRLSLKYHPDHGGDPGQFKLLNEAYAILSDPERRKLFDETGDVSQRKGQRAAESIIAAMVAEAFAQDSRDPIRWMQERIDARRDDHQAMRDKLSEGKRRLTDRITKFQEANNKTANLEGRDFILAVLENGMRDLEREIESHLSQIETLTASLAILNGLRGADEQYNAGYSWSTAGGWDALEMRLRTG